MIEQTKQDRQDVLLQALYQHSTIRSASVATDIPERTIRRWLNEDADFAKRYRQVRAHILRNAIQSAQYFLQKGAGIMASIVMDRNARDADRISAFRALADLAMRGFEALEVEDRLSAIEAQLDTPTYEAE